MALNYQSMLPIRKSPHHTQYTHTHIYIYMYAKRHLMFAKDKKMYGSFARDYWEERKKWRRRCASYILVAEYVHQLVE